MILPPVARCLVDFITPVYDPATQTFASKPGVEVEVKGFGQIVSLENLGPSLLPLDNFDYIRGFVKFMMTELHYTPGIDLFAAPYDWRYSPDVLKAQGYFTRLQALVESAYVSSGNRRVHLIGHSLVGGSVGLGVWGFGFIWAVGWVGGCLFIAPRPMWGYLLLKPTYIPWSLTHIETPPS